MSCKWIFKIKYNAGGFVIRHKVRLVARGFTQVEDIDFNEIFSFVAWMESIWIVFLILAIEYLKVHQMDVKITLINVDLSKDMYIYIYI